VETSELSFEYKDLPALFHLADSSAVKKQRAYYGVLLLQLGLFLLFAILTLFAKGNPALILIQIITLTTIFAIAIYLLVSKSMAQWYSFRALAESVKTLSWRFMTKTSPFTEADEEKARAEFDARLTELCTQDPELKTVLGMWEADPRLRLIPQKMVDLRDTTSEQRWELYRTWRVHDQFQWYQRKSLRNKRRYLAFTAAYVLSLFFAIILLILNYVIASNVTLPFDVLVTLASAFLTWIQAKRFSELASTYHQTSREIEHLALYEPPEITDAALSEFVQNTENAFSREHTTWFARKSS